MTAGQEGELDGAALLSFMGEDAKAQKGQRGLWDARGASEPLSPSPQTEVHPPVGIPAINQEIPTSTE